MDEYIKEQFMAAWERVEAVRKGYNKEGKKVCVCPACQMEAVDTINWWADFATGGECDEALHYQYKPNTREILPPGWSEAKLGGQ